MYRIHKKSIFFHLHVDHQICTMSGEALERSQEQNTASALDQTANKTLNIVLNANCISWGKNVLWDQSLQGERSCSRNAGKIFHNKNPPLWQGCTGNSRNVVVTWNEVEKQYGHERSAEGATF